MESQVSQQTIKDYWEKCTPMSFETEKWSYEQKREFRYRLQDYMHESFQFENWSGKKVLEIGCGSGVDAMEFARHGAIVTATDITDSAVKLTQELATETGFPVKVVKASANSLPLPDASFDGVYCYGVLHHIPEVETALAEIRRVLKPGGRVMAMLYHRDSLLYAYSIIYWRGIKEGMLETLTPEQLVSRYSERNEGCPYTRVYTRDEARNLFSSRFKQITIEVHYNVLDLPEQRKVKVDVPDTYELGWHLIVKAVK
jgi:ubiquinone/menaquinone biosynthesis C-methylase UbiE